MIKSLAIIEELESRLSHLPNVEIERGFLAQYQDKLESDEKKIVIQVLSDGPGSHKSDTTTQTTLNLVVCGLLPFNPLTAMTDIQIFLKETRDVIFHPSKPDRAGKFTGLCIDKPVELEESKYHSPSETQQNTYFIIPIGFKYTTKPVEH